jgi:hypothetical protein
LDKRSKKLRGEKRPKREKFGRRIAKGKKEDTAKIRVIHLFRLPAGINKSSKWLENWSK